MVMATAPRCWKAGTCTAERVHVNQNTLRRLLAAMATVLQGWGEDVCAAVCVCVCLCLCVCACVCVRAVAT